MIGLLAPNAAAIANAKKISQKNGFVKLCKTADDTLIFGECSGSGKSNYVTSADFIKETAPVFRCSCPSRQFPCKHGLAILFEYLAGKKFEISDVPEDIASKREKIEVKQEKKEKEKDAPPKINKAALAKKMKKQIEGLELTEKFTSDLLTAGLSTLAGTSLSGYKDLAKQLGDYYLPEPQAVLNEILLLAEKLKKSEKMDAIYFELVEKVVKLSTIAKKGIAFLKQKIENDAVEPEVSSLYDNLGYVWQLAQLRELGLTKENVELVQISFQVIYDEARQMYIDIGYWIDLENGEISKMENFRPVKAVKYIKQEDTVFDVLQIPCLYFYPGEINKRIRYEEMKNRKQEKEDREKIISLAQADKKQLIKQVKNQLKNTLSEKSVMALISYDNIGKINDWYVLKSGDFTIELKDKEESLKTVGQIATRLESLPDQMLLHNQVLAGEFFYDKESGRLCVMPHSIVSAGQIVRLLY